MSELPRVRRALVLFSCLAVFLLCNSASAQTRPKRTAPEGAPPQSIMWVGNSFFYYNNSMHNEYGPIVRSGQPGSRPRGLSVTMGGSGMDWHDLESYFSSKTIGRYSFVGDNEVVFNKPGRQFDAVLMMDCSQCPIHPQLTGSFHDSVKKNGEIARRYGAQPMLFMSWAYKDKPEMIRDLAEQYTIAGNANDMLVIPAGLAFSNAIAKRPDLEFYQADKRHPTRIGTYLAALTAYAAIWGKSPAGLPPPAGIDRDVATYLQGVAGDTVKTYYGR
jgi:hypothetical protein